jgi:hypothetical protein
VFSQPRLEEIAATEPKAVTPMERGALERLLDVATWLDIYRPELRIS